MSIDITELLKHETVLKKAANRMLGKHYQMAEDFVQDVMLRALTKGHQFEPGTNLRGWLMRILQNDIYTYFRKIQDRGTVALNNSEGETIDVAILPDQEIQIQWKEFAEVFAGLTKDHQRCIELILIDGRSYEEASAIENIPVGTMKSRVARARQAIIAQMELPDPDTISLGVLAHDTNFRSGYSR